jgi:hypothetical protein
VARIADILGIAHRKPADIFRALDRALKGVNVQLEVIGYETLIAAKRPTYWNLRRLDKGKRVRFEPTYDKPREEEPMAMDKQRATVKAKTKPPTETDGPTEEELRQWMKSDEYKKAMEAMRGEDTPGQARARRWLGMTPRERNTALALGERNPLAEWRRKMTEEDLREQEFDGE